MCVCAFATRTVCQNSILLFSRFISSLFRLANHNFELTILFSGKLIYRISFCKTIEMIHVIRDTLLFISISRVCINTLLSITSVHSESHILLIIWPKPTLNFIYSLYYHFLILSSISQFWYFFINRSNQFISNCF